MDGQSRTDAYAHWFAQLADYIPLHVLELIGPRAHTLGLILELLASLQSSPLRKLGGQKLGRQTTSPACCHTDRLL